MDVPRRDDPSRAKLSARVARTRIGNPRDEEKGRKMKQKMPKKGRREKKEKADRTPSEFSCSFSANFRRSINRKAGPESASECDEENARPISGRGGRTGKTRVRGSRWRTREEEGREMEVSDRQAKLARPSRGLADVK